MAGRDRHEPWSRGNNVDNGKKRKHEPQEYDGMGHTVSLLRQQPELEEFSLTSTKRQSQNGGSVKEDDIEGLQSADDWQVIENGRPRKKAKKIPKANSSNVNPQGPFLLGFTRPLLTPWSSTVPCNQVFFRFKTPIDDQDQRYTKSRALHPCRWAIPSICFRQTSSRDTQGCCADGSWFGEVYVR